MLSVKHNHSPWLHQLGRTRPAKHLDRNLATEVAIVGGGIAGVATAFFLLKHTDREVTLIEAHKVAHGATGHNAGQIASYFERPFRDLVKQFGLEMSAKAELSIHGAWGLLEEMYNECGVTTPLAKFHGYAGCKSLDHLHANLINNRHRAQAGIPLEQILIARDIDHPFDILREYEGLYQFTTHEDVLDKLQTTDAHYIAALSSQKGCVNSARFCEEVLAHLLETYGDRFEIIEHAPVHELRLNNGLAQLRTRHFNVWSHRVVLCTNGFENITIVNEDGDDIDEQFHHLVRGSIGYMVGFVERSKKPASAISYLLNSANHDDPFADAPYYYLTRRDHRIGNRGGYKLVCVGGPEALLENTNDYTKDQPYPQHAEKQFDQFLNDIKLKPEKVDYQYRWHGLMGYTSTGVRCIGPEPCNPVLMYNLGCNGVGILSSIYGAHRIFRYVNGEDVAPSIFDPKDQRGFKRRSVISDREWLMVFGAMTAALCAVISLLA